MTWQQIYNPFNNMVISTLLAAIPVVVMLVALGFLHIKAHIAALLGLIAAVAAPPLHLLEAGHGGALGMCGVHRLVEARTGR